MYQPCNAEKWPGRKDEVAKRYRQVSGKRVPLLCDIPALGYGGEAEGVIKEGEEVFVRSYGKYLTPEGAYWGIIVEAGGPLASDKRYGVVIRPGQV